MLEKVRYCSSLAFLRCMFCAVISLAVFFGNGFESKASGITILEQPKDVSAQIGETVEMSVRAVGEGLTYQWYYNRPDQTKFVAWTDMTESSVSITGKTYNDDTLIYCVITDSLGNTVTTRKAKFTLADSADDSSTDTVKWTQLGTFASRVMSDTFRVTANRTTANTSGISSDGLKNATYTFKSQNYYYEGVSGDVIRFSSQGSTAYVITRSFSGGVVNCLDNYTVDLYLCMNGRRYLLNGYCEQVMVQHVEHEKVAFYFEVDINVNYDLYFDSAYSNGYVDYTPEVTIPTFNVYYANYDELYGGDSSDVVSGLENQMEQQNQNAQEQLIELEEQNALQETANDLQQEANETSKGILDNITDFFGSFFENIINAFKSLFIPEDGYFEDFFQRMNDFFSEKLGALYAPIDIFISLMNGISNASGVDAGIPFPGVSWEGVEIIPATTISLSTYAKEFPELQKKIYFVTDIIMVGSVIWLLQVKLKEVMQN